MNIKELEPSLLSFNINNMETELKAAKSFGINVIHYDVMDGYVNNKAYDTEWLDLISSIGLKINVHLMVYNPIEWIKRFCLYNINTLTFQYEAISKEESILCLWEIKKNYVKAGIAIKPYSKPDDYKELLNHTDIITIMTVEPGKGGQSFIDDALINLKYVFDYRKNNKLNYMIEVDGGIKIDNVEKVLPYADYIVSGSGYMNIDNELKNKFINIVRGSNYEKK